MQLSKISQYRSELMGFAIIIVMLFHVYLPMSDAFYGLKRMGNVGVDVFFFLSGIGLWYSWSKKAQSPQRNIRKDLLNFYYNRALRIYPAWLLVAGYFYVSHFHGTTLDHYIDLFGDVFFNWDFWRRDELTFWYVPATMMLYIFAPPYMELVRRNPVMRWLVVLPLMWCIMVQYVTPIHHAVGHIEIFWSRVPIFFLGINCAEAVRQKQSYDKSTWGLVVFLFVVSLGACIWLEQYRHGKFPLYTERMLYIVLAITMILLLSELFSRTPLWVNKSMAWVGGISLEIYLIHVQFVLNPILKYHLGYWPSFLLTLVISLPLAWVVSKVAGYIIKVLK
ncbi:MAG: acyltransferase [Prevotella sp.]|nr:acyltransferase [Candidatus Prevotella equi]